MAASGDFDGFAVKKRKMKNKFKQMIADAAAEAPTLQPLLQAEGATRERKRKDKKKQNAAMEETVGVQADAPGTAAAPPPPSAAATHQPQTAASRPPVLSHPGRGKNGKGGSLLQQMRQRLQGGRFRWLNETLYTSDGAAALEMIQQQPELMEQYHEGFREQTKAWPLQPVDQAIRWLRGRPLGWTVADLGCGDAKIAATVAQTVHSFDLAATVPGVIACNMAAVPLPDAAVDAAIFCLSLMGTDYGAFLAEAARVLKPTGWLWIAEVQSRFMHSGGHSVLPAFLAALAELGFQVKRKDTSNSHFLVLELQRQDMQHKVNGGGDRQRSLEWPELRACQYKKR